MRSDFFSLPYGQCAEVVDLRWDQIDLKTVTEGQEGHAASHSLARPGSAEHLAQHELEKLIEVALTLMLA